MRVFRGVEQVPADFGPSAVTIGKFDGVHAGHRAVIDELRSAAAAESLASVVVTFDRHPLATLAPGKAPEPLVGLEHKIELLDETGVDAVVLLTFDEALSAVPAEEFVRSVIVDALDARDVLVGDDFRFGAKGAGNVETLKRMGPEHGFAVRVVSDVCPEGQRRVSSTWIRELLADGDVAHAAELLGHAPSVRGIVVHGAQRGHALGFPTANLSAEAEGLVPADGVYAGWLTVGSERYPAAISVGDNPTFEGVAAKQVEAYAIDQELDLYGRRVDVAFVERIRGMVAFTGIDDLIEQMRDDVRRARGILSQR